MTAPGDAEFAQADAIMEKMDAELCAFLNTNPTFTIPADAMTPHLLALIHLFCEKAGSALAGYWLETKTNDEKLSSMVGALISHHFHAALISVGDKILWKPEGSA